jgi:hypothetical protein
MRSKRKPAQQAFAFEDPSTADWVYTCPLRRSGETRWFAHRVLKRTAKRMYVSRTHVPVEHVGTAAEKPSDATSPYNVDRELFERQGWVHSCHKGNSAFYAKPHTERVKCLWEIQEERRAKREAEQRERDAWRAANPEEWAGQQRESEEAARRAWATAEDEIRQIWERVHGPGSYRGRGSIGRALFVTDYHDDARALGLPCPCSMAEVKAAYRRAALKAHPDRGGTAEQFRRVHEAYKRLAAVCR